VKNLAERQGREEREVPIPKQGAHPSLSVLSWFPMPKGA
jgi:hypothetical protein